RDLDRTQRHLLVEAGGKFAAVHAPRPDAAHDDRAFRRQGQPGLGAALLKGECAGAGAAFLAKLLDVDVSTGLEGDGSASIARNLTGDVAFGLDGAFLTGGKHSFGLDISLGDGADAAADFVEHEIPFDAA